jgi:TRAP-type C4-dicarboxylate transport system substrate-binding protein
MVPLHIRFGGYQPPTSVHITLTSHFFGAAVLLCHRASYDAWPTDLQHAVTAAAAEALPSPIE